MSSGAENRTLAVRLVCGLLALMSAPLAAERLSHSMSSQDGWTLLLFSLFLANLALTYRPATDMKFEVPLPRLIGIFVLCTIPSFVLLCIFGGRAEWLKPLITLFLLTSSVGPAILLSRYVRIPKNGDGG